MTTGIYKILNKITGKFYIGSAVSIEARWRRHKHDLRNNKHQNIHLQRAWIKYWEIDFEFIIIKICDKENLIKHEQLYLDWLKPYNRDIGYNLTPTAGNSNGVKHSEETRKRMSEAKKKMTKETKQLMSQQRKGKKLSEEHKIKIAAGGKGRKFTQETKDKISKAHKGRTFSDERKAQMSAYSTGRKRGKYKRKDDHIFENMNAPPLVNYNG